MRGSQSAASILEGAEDTSYTSLGSHKVSPQRGQMKLSTQTQKKTFLPDTNVPMPYVGFILSWARASHCRHGYVPEPPLGIMFKTGQRTEDVSGFLETGGTLLWKFRDAPGSSGVRV